MGKSQWEWKEGKQRGLANLASDGVSFITIGKWQSDLRLMPYLQCHLSYLVKMDYGVLLPPASEMLSELITHISPK